MTNETIGWPATATVPLVEERPSHQLILYVAGCRLCAGVGFGLSWGGQGQGGCPRKPRGKWRRRRPSTFLSFRFGPAACMCMCMCSKVQVQCTTAPVEAAATEQNELGLTKGTCVPPSRTTVRQCVPLYIIAVTLTIDRADVWRAPRQMAAICTTFSY